MLLNFFLATFSFIFTISTAFYFKFSIRKLCFSCRFRVVDEKFLIFYNSFAFKCFYLFLFTIYTPCRFSLWLHTNKCACKFASFFTYNYSNTNCPLRLTILHSRPPFEMQLAIHPHSFSYVSSHSLVTICLWGMVIYFIHKYCKNKIWLFVGIILSIIWILFVGISRIWLGVHNPTDVIGAYLLGVFLLSIYTKLFSKGVDNE